MDIVLFEKLCNKILSLLGFNLFKLLLLFSNNSISCRFNKKTMGVNAFFLNVPAAKTWV